MKIQRLEDKLKLAEELGLEVKYMYRQEVEQAMGLKFSRTNKEQIRRKLIGWRNHISVTICFLMLPSGFGLIGYAINKESIFYSIVGGLLACGAYFILTNIRLTVDTMPLRKWQNDMPYGAMLAVKEAHDKGFSNFTIHYPVKAHSYERFIADPIITANSPSGILCEIFFWDDRKIYELDGTEA